MNGKDKRLFERKRKRLAFNLLVRGRPFKAETIDYSMAGIGAMIEDSPPVSPGDILDVDIPASSIKFKGQVVRSEKFPDSTKVGIVRLSPISGSLRDFRLSDIIIGLQRNGRTGILDIKSGPENRLIHKWVYVDGGDLIFAGSNQSSDRLGDMLLREGRLTEEQYIKSSEVMLKTGKRHGAVLVQLGYLKPLELPMAVKRYVERMIEGLFTLKDGLFEFRETPLPKEEVITLKLSPANLIYRGIKTARDIEAIKEDFPPPEAVLSFSSNPLDLFQDIRLDEEDKRILAFVDGKTPIKDIFAFVPRAEEDILKSVYALLETRVIEVAEPGVEEPPVSAEEVIEEPAKEADSELMDRIERLFMECGALDYYRVLALKDTATSAEVKKAYYRMAKEYHPDKHYHLPSDMKYKLNSVFSYITTAYSTLSNSERRKQYDKSLTVKPERLGSNTEVAQKRFEEGRADFNHKRFEEAARLFAEAVYLDGSISKYHFYQGLCLGRLGRHKEAERCMGRALQKEPLNAEYLSEAGHIYLALGLMARAKGSFEKALKAEPSNGRAKEGLLKVEEK